MPRVPRLSRTFARAVPPRALCRTCRFTSPPAFTMVELLVLTAIFGVFVSLWLPAVQRARETVAAAQCRNNLCQLVLGLHHADDVMGSMPPATGFWPTEENWYNPYAPGYYAGPPPVVLATAHVHLYPYLEQQNKWNNFIYANSWFNFWSPTQSTPAPFLCLSDPSLPGPDPRNIWNMPLTSYAANAAALGCYGWTFNPSTDTFTRHQRATLASGFPDGTSLTIVFYDRLAQPNGYVNGLLWCWGPDNGPPILGYKNWMLSLPPQAGLIPSVVDPYRSNSGHLNVVQVALADGSVRAVSTSISPTTWENAQRPNDGMPLGSDW